jgi:hypothetical protein
MTFPKKAILAGIQLLVISFGSAIGVVPVGVAAQAAPEKTVISAVALTTEVGNFVDREVAAHFENIKSLNPPPESVFGALTTGDFSWGSYARTLAAEADISGQRIIAGKDTARAVAEMGLYESRKGGKTFAQLYAAEALLHYGADLSKNAVWQSMTDAERKEWLSLLDPSRFYDANKRIVINLPENYLGVAARITAMSYQLGVMKDRGFLDSIVERAAEQFTKGALYSDDNPPTGRYDRYSNEYERFCWFAADVAGREDIKSKLLPSLKRQMQLWWDVVSPAGYGYNWGRSQGLTSYMDTLEIVAFLASNPEFRPAPLAQLAALYYQAWRWLQADYNDQTHQFRVFDYGRGNYSYINPTREWQQTTVGFGKMILANQQFAKAMAAEGVEKFPAVPSLPDVARFEYFSRSAEKQNGVWLVRHGNFQFALPIVAGTKPAVADYLPAPFGLIGFAAPVEEVYPSMVPFLTFSDGNTYAACDGADEINPGRDGRSLEIINRRWSPVGGKPGERADVGLTSKVGWRLDGNILTRTEELIAQRDIRIQSWRFAFPTTASSVKADDSSSYRLEGRDGGLTVRINAPDGAKFEILATGDSRLGKGVLGAIPIHLIASAGPRSLAKGDRIVWKLILELDK